MKYLFIIFIFLSTSGYSQTYISPLIGGEYLYFIEETKEPVDNSNRIIVYNNLNNLSIASGLKIEQLVFNRTFISYSFSFSKYSIDYYDFLNFIPEQSFSFRYFKNSFGLNYYLNKFIFLGFGMNINSISNIKGLTNSNVIFKGNRNEVGGFALINIDIENLILSFKMSNFIFYPNKAEENYDFKGTRGFEVLIGYRFKVLKKLKDKDRVLCPN